MDLDDYTDEQLGADVRDCIRQIVDARIEEHAAVARLGMEEPDAWRQWEPDGWGYDEADNVVLETGLFDVFSDLLDAELRRRQGEAAQ